MLCVYACCRVCCFALLYVVCCCYALSCGVVCCVMLYVVDVMCCVVYRWVLLYIDVCVCALCVSLCIYARLYVMRVSMCEVACHCASVCVIVCCDDVDVVVVLRYVDVKYCVWCFMLSCVVPI